MGFNNTALAARTLNAAEILSQYELFESQHTPREERERIERRLYGLAQARYSAGFLPLSGSIEDQERVRSLLKDTFSVHPRVP
jgi:hypothetical protein